ncbi:MAG: S8 family peptidase [Phycisphaerales bacterium]|nr:S8 family peptidase [Phycisphaerales bacterium]
MFMKHGLSVALLLVASAVAIAQPLDQNAAVTLNDAGQPAGAKRWVWENPDKAWLNAWYKNRNAIVDGNTKLTADPTSILIQFTPGTTQAQVLAALKTIGGRTIQTWGLVPNLHHVAIPTDRLTVEQAIAAIRAHGHAGGTIVFAEPDYLGHLGATPNDTFYSLEWGMNNTGQTVASTDTGTANADIDADLAWDVTTGNASFVVGMCDSGIKATHEDLAANRWTNTAEILGDRIDNDGNGLIDDSWGWDFWNNDNNPTDDNGHGTHTAGTVGAQGNNGKGVAGVCWTVKLAGLKIGSRQGSVSTSAAISALNYCVGKQIRLSNHSWSGGAFTASLNTAITNARAAGHMLICAAGNGGRDGVGDNNDSVPQYPANYAQDNIISVAAIDNDNRLSTYSNYGATTVDIAAPGDNIASCSTGSGNTNNSYVYLSGTSMATPHVTGVCALVWGLNPTWTYSQVRAKVLTTGKPVPALTGRCATGSCINANNAVR